MRSIRFALAGCGVLFATAALAAPPGDAAALIDRHLTAGWEAAKLTPAPPADDAEFVRRVYLDLAGRIPLATEARQFLDSKRPNKRRELVEHLLAGSNYANHFTSVWRSLLIPEADSSLQARFQLPGFESWLRNHLAENSGYDQMVRELITAPLNFGNGKGVGFGDSNPSPTAFFFAKDLLPENLAAAASRVFLGVKLECAQCHNHPFASWKRDDFWSLAAFFAGVKRQGPGEVLMPAPEEIAKHEIAIPNTDRTAKARFLDGKQPAWKKGVSSRATLANWITAPDNPYFARATVNRMWAYFFGSGLVDPVDEMVGADVAVSYPRLLDELSKAFVDSKFDLKFLIRSIVMSKAYQLSSRSAGASEDDPRQFIRMPLRGLTPEQLFDSVAKATGFQENTSNLPPGVIIGGRGNPRAEFLARFGSRDKPTEHQTSILQALALMNGKFVSDATSVERSQTLAGVLDAPFMTTQEKIEALYLAALSRRPSAKETARLARFIDENQHGAKNDSEKRKRNQESLADIFWTLLNSAEFMLNH